MAYPSKPSSPSLLSNQEHTSHEHSWSAAPSTVFLMEIITQVQILGSRGEFVWSKSISLFKPVTYASNALPHQNIDIFKQKVQQTVHCFGFPI